MPSSYIGGMDVLISAFCRTRRLTMTSNAEEQANTPAATAVQPPKATKRGHVPPDKRRIAPGKQNRERRPAGPTAAQKPKGRQTGQTRCRCPRGQHGSQSPKPAEAAGRRFVERANESYRLVGAFRPWVPQRRARQEDEAQARVREGSAATPSKGEPHKGHLNKEPPRPCPAAFL